MRRSSTALRCAVALLGMVLLTLPNHGRAAAIQRLKSMWLNNAKRGVPKEFAPGTAMLHLVDTEQLPDKCKPSIDPLKQQLFECFRDMQLAIDRNTAELNFEQETSPEGMYCKIYTFQGQVEGDILNFTKLVFNKKKADEYYAHHSQLQEALVQAERQSLVEDLVEDIVSFVTGGKRRKLQAKEPARASEQHRSDSIGTFTGRKMQGVLEEAMQAAISNDQDFDATYVEQDEAYGNERMDTRSVHLPMSDSLKQRFATLVVTHALGISQDTAQKLLASKFSQQPEKPSYGLSNMARKGVASSMSKLHRHSINLPTQPFNRDNQITVNIEIDETVEPIQPPVDEDYDNTFDSILGVESGRVAKAQAAASSSSSSKGQQYTYQHTSKAERLLPDRQRKLLQEFDAADESMAKNDIIIEAQIHALNKRGDKNQIYKSAQSLWKAIQQEAVKRTVSVLQEDQLMGELESIAEAENKAWKRLKDANAFMGELSAYYKDLESKQDDLTSKLGAVLDKQAKARSEEQALRHALDAILQLSGDKDGSDQDFTDDDEGTVEPQTVQDKDDSTTSNKKFQARRESYPEVGIMTHDRTPFLDYPDDGNDYYAQEADLQNAKVTTNGAATTTPKTNRKQQPAKDSDEQALEEVSDALLEAVRSDKVTSNGAATTTPKTNRKRQLGKDSDEETLEEVSDALLEAIRSDIQASVNAAKQTEAAEQSKDSTEKSSARVASRKQAAASMLHAAMESTEQNDKTSGTNVESTHSHMYVLNGVYHWKFDDECTYKYQLSTT